jgi:hypothetical protein
MTRNKITNYGLKKLPFFPYSLFLFILNVSMDEQWETMFS